MHIESSPAGSTEYICDTSDRLIQVVRTGTERATLTTAFGCEGAERIPSSITTLDQKTTTQGIVDGLVRRFGVEQGVGL